MYKLIQRLQMVIKKHPILMLTVLIWGTAVLTYGEFVFGDKLFIFNDVGLDTRNLYYPFFTALSKKLEQGDFSLWDFSYGMGTNMLTRQSDIINVFTYLTCLLGTEHIDEMLIFVHILKITLTGYVCYFYLSNFKFETWIKVLVAYIFAFNGFTVLWGQHYFFASACLNVLLMLWSVESVLKSKKGHVFLVFTTCYVMITNYYLAYMIFLFVAGYTIFRICALYTFQDIKVISRKILSMFISVLIGCCLSAFIFVPSVYLLTSTSARLTTDTGIYEKISDYLRMTYDNDTIIGIVSRFFSNNLMGTGDFTGVRNYYEMPQWFFSCFNSFVGIIFASEVLLNKTESKKTKFLNLVAIFSVLYVMFFPFVPFVLNGFVTDFFRYTYLFMPILGLCYCSTFTKIFYNKLTYPKTQICIAGAVTILLLGVSLYRTEQPNLIISLLSYGYLGLVLCMIVVMILAQRKHQLTLAKTWCVLISIGVLVINISVETWVTNNVRGIQTKQLQNGQLTEVGNDIQAALEQLEDDTTFFRTEKTFSDIGMWNDSMLHGYNGISTYNSVINKNILEFSEHLCPQLIEDTRHGMCNFQHIVENNTVASLLGVKYILSYEQLTDMSEYEYMKTIGDIHIYRNTGTDGIGRFYGKAMDYEQFCVLNEQSKRLVVEDTVVINDLHNKDDVHIIEEESRVTFQKPSNSGYIEGKADIRQNGWIFVAIPFEKGWNAYVDGDKVEILKANIGFMAIPVQKGQHKIILQYNTPYLREGIIISCLGIVSLLAWCWVLRKQGTEVKEGTLGGTDSYVSHSTES